MATATLSASQLSGCECRARSAGPIEVSSLCAACGRAWVASLDTWLLDCDGVVWRGSSAVPGAGAATAALKAAGKRVLFVSNNSTKSVDDYVAKLASVCGIVAQPSQVVTSAVAAASWCASPAAAAAFGGRDKLSAGDRAYVIGSSALADAVRSAGFDVDEAEGGPSDGSRTFSFGSMTPADLDKRVRAVVVGFDPDFSYFKLSRAASYLRYGSPRVAFVATNGDLTFPDTHQIVPGGGVLVAAVAAASGREPDVVAGKPSLAMLDILAAAPDGLDRDRTVMVGDRLDTDILFGAAGGLRATLLVMTGVTQPGEVEALPVGDARRPTHILPSLGDLAPLLQRWGIAKAL